MLWMAFGVAATLRILGHERDGLDAQVGGPPIMALDFHMSGQWS
jgi:hypothetical protein